MLSHGNEPKRTNPNYLRFLRNYRASGLVGKAERLLIAVAAAITVASWLSGKW
jgi:hypothetical protein